MSCSFGPGQSLDDMIDEIRRLRANVLPRGLAGQLEVQTTTGELSFFWGTEWKWLGVGAVKMWRKIWSVKVNLVFKTTVVSLLTWCEKAWLTLVQPPVTLTKSFQYHLNSFSSRCHLICPRGPLTFFPFSFKHFYWPSRSIRTPGVSVGIFHSSKKMPGLYWFI